MIGEYILQDQRVAKISFTGSTAVGKVHKYIHHMHSVSINDSSFVIVINGWLC